MSILQDNHQAHEANTCFADGVVTNTFQPDPLAVVARGLSVGPLPRNGRVPAIEKWAHRSTNDPEVIARHWVPGSNIYVPCKPNNLLGLDLDRNHSAADGIETLRALCETHGQPWPDTFTVESPRGGWHLYTWVPPGRMFGNTAGRLGAGIDTRGPGIGNDGGYLIGPGSIVNGKTYKVIRDVPIQVLPEWLAELLDPPKVQAPRNVGPLPQFRDRYVTAAVEGEVQRVLDAQSNGLGRNDELNRAAFILGTLVGAHVLDRGDAETALTQAAYAVGLDADTNCNPAQIARTIASGLNSGERHPRRIKGVR